MAQQNDFTIPQGQDVTLQVTLNTPTNISGWEIQSDIMYRLGSPQPIYTAFCASGFNNVSGINVIDGVNGKFLVPLFYSVISGVQLGTGVLTHRSRRVDSGAATDLDGGAIVLSPF